MAQNLLKAISIVRSNGFNNVRLASGARCFQLFHNPIQKYHNTTMKINLRPHIWAAVNNIIKRNAETNAISMKTDVANNVMLWRNDNTKYYRNLGAFGVAQFFALLFFGYAMYTYLPLKKYDETWKEWVIRSSIILIATIAPAIISILASLLIWLYIVRSLKYLILNKGGQTVTLVTNHPFKESRQLIVPIEKIRTSKSRKDVGQYMSLKVENKMSYYLMDRDGHFVNPLLFDCTVGTRR